MKTYILDVVRFNVQDIKAVRADRSAESHVGKCEALSLLC